MLGNIKFIGELSKLEMLQEGIMHRCIQQLLEKKRKVQIKEMAEDLECLCQIMQTVGKRLDSDRARLWMDQYFERMEVYQSNPHLPSRIRFMLQDVTDLRQNKWRPRKINLNTGPRTIQQVRDEAAREHAGIAMSYGHHGPMQPFPSMSIDIFGRPLNGGMNSGMNTGMSGKSGMSDFFGPLSPPPLMSTGGIGMGPGVISTDNFTPNFMGGRGRGRNQQFNSGGGQGSYRGRQQQGQEEGRYSGGRGGGYSSSPFIREREADRDGDEDSDEDYGTGKPRNGGGRGGGGGGADQYSRHGNRGSGGGAGGAGTRSPYYQRGGGGGRDANDQENVPPRKGLGPSGQRGSPSLDHQDRFRDRPAPGQRDREREVDKDFRSGDQRDREFRDGRSRDFRDGDRGAPPADRDFRDNRDGRFQRQAPPQTAPRELPPRLQRKLQQQQQQQSPPCDTPPPGGPGDYSQHPPSAPAGPNPPPVFRPGVAGMHTPPHYFPSRFTPPQRTPVMQPGLPGPGGPQGPIPSFPSSRQPTPRTMSPQHGGPAQKAPPEEPPEPAMPSPHDLPKGPANPDEISLRPRNFTPTFRPNTPSMLPRSAQIPSGPPPLVQRVVQPEIIVAPNLNIKQVASLERPKREEKKNERNMSSEALKEAMDAMLKAFNDSGNVEEAVNTLKDIRPPNRVLPDLVYRLVTTALEKTDEDRENTNKLTLALNDQGILNSLLYMDGLVKVLDNLAEIEKEVALVKSNVARLAAQAVSGGLVTLVELADPMRNGAHYPLFLLCLQQLHRVRDNDWLLQVFVDSKIDLQSMLPECDRTKDRMMEILEDRGLSFIFPLLRVQSDLWKQIRADPNPANFYKWIKDNVSCKVQTDPGFITTLFTTVLRYVCGETTLKEGSDQTNPPDKVACDKEKDLLTKYKGVLAVFLHDHLDLQVTAIYAIQVFGHSNGFPKGIMLRLFMDMYDLEIVDEEAFLRWKEEVNDEYPGKGKVLFQVNQWLTWLEQAEEESDDED